VKTEEKKEGTERKNRVKNKGRKSEKSEGNKKKGK
jgi:hypothetical protein